MVVGVAWCGVAVGVVLMWVVMWYGGMVWWWRDGVEVWLRDVWL